MSRLVVPLEIYPLQAIEEAIAGFQNLVEVTFERKDDDMQIDMAVITGAYKPEIVRAEFLNYLLDAAAQHQLGENRQ